MGRPPLENKKLIVAIRMSPALIDEVRERAGPRGFSSFVEEAVMARLASERRKATRAARDAVK